MTTFWCAYDVTIFFFLNNFLKNQGSLKITKIVINFKLLIGRYIRNNEKKITSSCTLKFCDPQFDN